jgi:hypothetical protein
MPDGFDFAFWEEVRQLVQTKRKRWKGEWLTAKQVGNLLQAGYRNVNMAIHVGNIKAIRWGNWRIKRSDLRSGKIINSHGEWVDSIRRVRPICDGKSNRNAAGGPEARLTIKQMEILQEIRRAKKWIRPGCIADNLGRSHLGSAWSCPACLQLVAFGLVEKRGWYYRAFPPKRRSR